MSTPSPRFHHVANGTSTTAIIRRARLPGTTSIWADPLHDGPVPEGLSDDELLEVRARLLADGSTSSVADVAAELRRWRAMVDDTGAYDELVLWYEHDLFDQLNLIQLLSRIHRTVAVVRPVVLICDDSFPGRPEFKGLGELRPEELAPLFDTRRRVTDAQHTLAERAWRAFRSPDPRQLTSLLDGDTSDLPFLAPALARHLEELPSAIDGLSRSERRLLELAGPGPVDLWNVFHRMSDGETAFYITDFSFWRMIGALAASSPPLVEVDVRSPSGMQLPRGTIAATAIGRAVLAGELDRVARCGVDRWLGGVHLEGRSGVWRWDAEKGRVVEGARAL